MSEISKDIYNEILTTDSFTYNTKILHTFKFDASSFTRVRGDGDMWTREGRPHTVLLQLMLSAESITPSEFVLEIFCRHSEDRKDYSTWQLSKKISIPVQLKDNESFVRFNKATFRSSKDDLSWAISSTAKADTSEGGDHGWIRYPSSAFLKNARSRIDTFGKDDHVQAVVGQLEIPFIVFVQIRGSGDNNDVVIPPDR